MNAVRSLICFLPVVPGILTGCATTTTGTKAVDEYVELKSTPVEDSPSQARSPRERLERDPAYRMVGPALAIGMGAPRGAASTADPTVKLWTLIAR